MNKASFRRLVVLEVVIRDGRTVRRMFSDGNDTIGSGYLRIGGPK